MPEVNGAHIRRVAAVNDLSCFGKCSLTVAQPVLSACGIEAVPLPTAVLSTHTGGFPGYTCLSMTAEMRRIAAHWKSLSLHFDGIYTGYFCGCEQLDFMRDFLRDFRAPDTLLLVDPVMGDAGRLYAGFAPEHIEKMRALCAAADYITPNLTEAFLLAGMPVPEQPTADEVQACRARLLRDGAKHIVITSVRRGGEIGYACAGADGETFELWGPFEKTAMHGCGDVFASALCGALVGGLAFRPAVEKAAAFTQRCVEATARDYPGHWYGMKFEECLKDGVL